MKSIILALASVVAVVGVTAQGTIIFKTKKGSDINAPASLVDRMGVDLGKKATGPATAGQPGYYGELLWAATQTGSFAPCVGIKVGGTVEEAVREVFLATGSGWINGGDWTLTGVPSATASWFKVAGYYATTGVEKYADLASNPDNIVGLSAAFQVTTGGPKPGGGTADPAAALIGLQAWNIAVPEPSVIALGLLGLGAFLLRRRS